LINYVEYNFDGLVGPTHNYAGLSFGNIASQHNAGAVANPKMAAKQGLQKMLTLMNLGVPQAVLPPQQRPNLDLLRDFGINGTNAQMLRQAHKINPSLLAAVYSAASMWTANMATVSPSCNTVDGRLHFTPANLSYNMHRAQEAQFSYNLLKQIFSDQLHFVVHNPLPGYRDLSDEGAANHSLLCTEYGEAGLELYVYGRNGLDDKNQIHLRYPARQTRLASAAIAQRHGVRSNLRCFIQQNPIAINAGVFHNDVVFVANKNVMFYHEHAFLDWPNMQQQIISFFNGDCYFIPVTEDELNMSHAVETYIFNSQLVSLPDNSMALIMPTECEESAAVIKVLDSVIAGNNPIKQIKYVQCRQSMRNGGGPACLRLRVLLSNAQKEIFNQQIVMTEYLYKQLDAWIDKHYRDRLTSDDFLDPDLITEVNTALESLTKILHLGSIYPFQQI
jgi:succinylarginine dihydrolase